MEQATLKVEGMSCQHCVKAIEGALQAARVDGKVDLENNTVAIRFDSAASSLESIGEIIADQGYDVVGRTDG